MGASSTFRRICVGTITRNRPQLLTKLLDSYLAMAIPENVVVSFAIVENSETATLHDIVAAFREKAGGRTVHYKIEPRPGIASARNCVLEHAIDAGDDLLAFVDDDEAVTSDWLINLLAERDASDLTIVGSPVRLESPSADISRWKRFIWVGLNRANRHSENKALELWKNKEADRISIATGSWLGKLDFFRSTSLRFDISLGMAGGEDWRLWRAARALGATTGWSPHAIVYEYVPPERLSLQYQYRRSRDTSMTLFGAKLKSKKGATLAKLPGSLLARCITLLFNVAAIPFTNGRTLIRAVISAGSIMGVFYACVGRTSSHYA